MGELSLIIIESNESVLNNLTHYFNTSEEIEVIETAKDGIEGLEKINRLMPDALILDIVLPSIDGYGVLERIANISKRPSIIVYSAFSTESFITKAIKLGVDYFMVKPCNLDMLKERLVEICSFSRSIKENKSANITSTIQRQSEKTFRSKTLEERITNIFITVGIPPHIKGYGYLREAVKMSVFDPEIINCITKRLYPSIAERYATSSSKVERAIRHAIEVAWNRGKMENVNNLFGIKIYSNNDKPTNGEFIALIADKMLLEGA